MTPLAGRGVDLIAHQGGWDEIWLPLGIIVVAVAYAVKRRRSHDGSPPAHCLYCGRDMPPEAERCEACGFKKKGSKP